jgi:MFS family permease
MSQSSVAVDTSPPATRQSNRNLYAFGATSLLNDTASEMAYWVLPAFIVSLGAGAGQLGIIEGVAECVASLFKLFSGLLTDRVTRRKPIVVAGYFVANAVKPLLAVTTAWWQVLLIRFADRTAKGVRGTPRDVMLAESVDKSTIGGAYGLLQSMDSAGAIVGPLLALVLLQFVSLRSLFWFAAIPGALAILTVVLFVRETGARSSATAKGPRADAQGVSLPGSYYFVLIAVLIFSLGNSSDMFLVLRAEEAGISAKSAPLLGLLFNLVYTAGSWPAGRLSDRISRKWIAALGYLVFAVVYVTFALAPQKFASGSAHLAIWTAMAIYGSYYALTAPVLKAMVVDEAPAGARGRALGIFYFITSIAALLSSVITGYLWKRFGAALPLTLSASLAALAALMLMMFRKRSEND